MIATISKQVFLPVASIDLIKRQKREIIARYANGSDLRGFLQVVTTLVPFAFAWWLAVQAAAISGWLVCAAVVPVALLTLRAFVLMHDCGHRSLFVSPRLNQAFGFLFGVITGMPQYVWAQHHNFHHTHNGNWERYRGPYGTLSIDEYDRLGAGAQRFYRAKCAMATAPLAGFIYLVFNPRFTWLRGTLGLLGHMVSGKFSAPSRPLRALAADYRTRYWKSPTEYWHMCANNLSLFGVWAVMCWACGPLLFFAIWIASVSIAGGGGIVLFTVQHNFEHSYASTSEGWDYDVGAIDGTSYLVLPGWMNWFTGDIGYHHVHHLSASIPNYRLAACHAEYKHLFGTVRRITLAELPAALHCIFWDVAARRIISMAEYARR